MTRGPFFSGLAIDARRLLEDRRRAQETQAPAKLALLRRLQGRYIECNLPAVAETRVEQSFNELLFRGVLGYSTLFSHGELPFHLHPKTSAGGKYDDFSLGFFFGEETDRVMVSAELKDAGCSLDARQTGRREKLTPVEQGLRTAHLITGCAFCIVCNFRELRLYNLANDALLAAVDLLEVRDRQQLAFLCAHFDRQALLGNGTGDVMRALDPKHPSAPVESAADSYRLVTTFTPTVEVETPMFVLHDQLRAAAVERLRIVKAASPYGRKEAWKDVSLDIREGWCVLRVPDRALAVSALGQVRYSLCRKRREGKAQINPDVGFWDLFDDLRTFLQTTLWLHEVRWPKGFAGYVSVTLHEVKGWRMYLEGDGGLLQENYKQNAGIAKDDLLSVGALRLASYSHAAGVLTTALSELGLHFIGDNGDRLRFDDGKLLAQLASDFPPPGVESDGKTS